MKLSVSKLGVSKLATGRSIDYSVASLFSGLLNDQDLKRSYLLDMTPYDTTLASEVSVGFSDGITWPVLNNRMFPARLKTILNSEVNLFSDDIGRGGSSSLGVIKILIGDRENDTLLDYAWDGRLVRVLMGLDGFAFEEFEEVFVGTAVDIEHDYTTLSISIRDKSELLQVNIQSNTYAGTGGVEGGTDLVGVPKPLGYGYIRNAKPVLVDRTNLIYQFHDGSVDSVIGAFDGGAPYTFSADVADITATTVSPGYYKTQLSGGYIKLGSEPALALTVDFTGDNSDTGYIDTAPYLVRRIVTSKSSLTDSDIDLESVSTTGVANNSPVGIYITGQGTLISTVISQLMESIGGSWVFDRVGNLQLGIFAFSTPVETVYEKDVLTLRRVKTPIPTWSRKLGYAKCWHVQPQGEVAGAATTAKKDFVAQEFRYVTSKNTSISDVHKLSPEIEIQTLLKEETDAATEVARQQAIFGANRVKYEVVTKRQQFKYRPGQTITIDIPRFGFPKDCLILGIIEDTDKRLTTMRLLA